MAGDGGGDDGSDETLSVSSIFCLATGDDEESSSEESGSESDLQDLIEQQRLMSSREFKVAK